MSSQHSLLVQLPEACLLAVLRCCADDLQALFSAARAHSRLYHAASLALDSIQLTDTHQHQLDGMLLYLATHGQHVGSVNLKGFAEYEDRTTIRQLPPNLQLTSLQLDRFHVQLQPGDGFQGVLGAAASVAALKQLCLRNCELHDRHRSLAALLELRTVLEHLSITGVTLGLGMLRASCSTDVLQQLQCLTHLEFDEAVTFQGPTKAPATLHFLQALTRLADLRLVQEYDRPRSWRESTDYTITADMLSDNLTRLELFEAHIETGALAGKTLLQHLNLRRCASTDIAAGTAYLLLPLQHMQQLTHLDLNVSHIVGPQATIPAAAFSALTASSGLQYLRITGTILPEGVWQHVFPAGRQLPRLQELCVTYISHPSGSPTQFPEGSRLVSCCPGLQALVYMRLQYSAGQLAALRGLTGLHKLVLREVEGSTGGEIGEVGQLTGLRRLTLCTKHTIEGSLQLTKLQHLTSLDYSY